MNKTQAIAKLRKVLGKNFAYRENAKALGPDERAAELERSRALRIEQNAAEAAMNARRAELLRDPEYIALRARYEQLKADQQIAWSRAYHQRISVGTANSLFFSVKAEGDNWQEVVEAVCKKHEAA